MDDDLPHSPRSSPAPAHTHTTLIPSSPPFAPFNPRYRATSPTSSEPPLFSSDDGPEAADITNYQSPRHKAKRAGPWWSNPYERPAARNKKAKISRNFDSGVFMMSDSSEATNDLLMGDETSPESVTPLEREEFERKARVLHRIQRTIDNKDAINRSDTDNNYVFSQFEMQDSDLHHLASLKQIIRHPPDYSTELPSEGQYRSLVPDLSLDLSKNLLRLLSPRLFDLEHLTSLVLRNNKIESLPPQIAKLPNLLTLDLAGNRLTHLPAEVLSIAVKDYTTEKNRFMRPSFFLRLNLFDNPLFDPAQMAPYRVGEPEDKDKDENPNEIRRTHHLHCPEFIPIELLSRIGTPAPMSTIRPTRYQHTVIRTCRNIMLHSFSPVSYFDRFGDVVPGSAVLSPRGVFGDPKYPNGTQAVDPLLEKYRPTDPGTSLFGAAFFKALDELPVQQIREYLGSESTPTIDAKLALVEDNYARIPRRHCHTCGKEYVIPRAEWLEFWDWPRRSDQVPVKVQVCSWSCVPEIIGK